MRTFDTAAPMLPTVSHAFVRDWLESTTWDKNSPPPELPPDIVAKTREKYIEAYEKMANLATRAGVEGQARLRVHVPLIQLTKAQIIQRGLELGVDNSLTLTCYDPAPDAAACGHCDSCLLRLKGFAEAGVTDPARYT